MISLAKCFCDDYLNVGKLKNFCDSHKLKKSENKAELIRNILEFAGNNSEDIQYIETYNWILQAIKDGTKDICYKKIYYDDDTFNSIEQKIFNRFPSCPRTDILSYQNTKSFELVDYEIKMDDKGKLAMVSFLFSKLVLEGSISDEVGEESIYPVYIDLYIKEGFIVSRIKPKATIYEDSENKMLYKENRIKTISSAVDLMDDIIKLFSLRQDLNFTRHKVRKMLFKLYNYYSVTPKEVEDEIQKVKPITDEYVNKIFKVLELNICNIPQALQDLSIFLEKYVSINGDMEYIFKENREAYLIKISSDDASQMTSFDAKSAMTKPLQCTDIFYDGKKSVLTTKECKKLNLCYNRHRGYLQAFPVQFSEMTTFGLIKMQYCPEEVDIQDVLQTVFRNY